MSDPAKFPSMTTASPITLTIEKNGTFTGVTTIYLVLYGEQDGKFAYYDWPSSTWKEAVKGTAFPAFAYTVELTAGPKVITTVTVPYLNGARLYVSYDKKPVFTPTSTTGIAAPTPWNPSDSLHETIVDKFEFTTNQDPGSGMVKLNVNTTCVDFFGIPIQFKIKGYKGATTQSEIVEYNRGITNQRSAIYTGISTIDNFKKLIQGPSSTTKDNFYRIVSPNRGLGSIGVFPKDYLDNYINNTWDNVFGKAKGAPTIYLENINPNVLPVGTPTWKYIGSMNASNELEFTCSNSTNGIAPFVNKAKVTIAKPDSATVFLNEITALGSKIGTGTDTDVTDCKNFLTAQLGAAICRTVFHMIGDDNTSGISMWSKYSNFYQQKTEKYGKQAINDYYSQILHNNSIDNICYSIPFSDQYDFSSFAAVFKPTVFSVIINDATS